MRIGLLFTFASLVLSVFRPSPQSPLRQSTNHFRKHYHHSQLYYEEAIKRLNSKNITTQTSSILNDRAQFDKNQNDTDYPNDGQEMPEIKIIIQGGFLNLNNGMFNNDNDNDGSDEFNPFNIFEQQSRQQEQDGEDDDVEQRRRRRQGLDRPERIKSKNFEVVKNYPIKFNDVGGYEKIKDELRQSIDILKNFQKYQKYNVRIPKGLILEGPPGNGKTLIAKSIAGESGCVFIAVSGSDFQEKYVGVGSSRIRELFELAKKNSPCIIFVDEIDAIGRKRSGDGESASSERDNTLNSILVELDGFKNNTGIFLVGATNRIDLLDPALLRPGRIDKKIFIGLPDLKTRTEVLGIHINGKPHDQTVQIPELVELTDGLSCAQIESLLNEAMLFALRKNRTAFNYDDVNVIFNKIIAGWQSTDHEFSQDMIDRITVHEMGHAILGFLAKYHSKMQKVVLNLSSPKTPGYTVFERSASSIYLKEALFEHLIILLGGRIAEEVVYNVSITTGAINDFEEALKLAERMIVYYGMGETILYPSSSEKYKEIIDDEVSLLINSAYALGRGVLENCHDIIVETSTRLQKEKQLNAAVLSEIIHETYPEVLTLKETF